MLGMTAERFPGGGALALGIIGSAGSFATALAGPAMGWINDNYGADRVLPYWAALPVAVAVIFATMLWIERAQGSFRATRVA
jgi:MFS family permease